MSDGFDDTPHEDPATAEDARLLDDVRRALGGVDAPPAGLVARADGLVAFMDVDRELVALLDEAAQPVGSRGPATFDRLVFEVGDGSVSLELSNDRDRLVGQVLAGEVAIVRLEALDREIDASSVDALGRFSLRPAQGPARLRLEDGSGRPLATDWFLL